MNKEYNIVGLDCGHCALTLEKYLEKIDGVKSCNVNFSTSKVFLEIDDVNSKLITKKIFQTTKEVNPSVKLTDVSENVKNANIIDIILYVIGLMLGVLVVFVPMVRWLYWSLLIVSALLMGYKTYYKALIQLKTFKINENTLITLSLIGAVAIGESMEGLMVIALYTLGKLLEAKAVRYSRQSISMLINNQPEFAMIIKGDREQKVKPEVVNIGDRIVVRPGEKVALDGVVVEGSASVDKKHLTGESNAKIIQVGDVIESGSIVLDSTIVVEVTCEYKDSTVSKILNLVTNASNKKSKTETIISKFSSWYTLGVILSSILVWGISWIVLKDISTAVYRGLIFLVVSCPCAFAISVPLTYFSGIGRCSKQGILIKGSNFIDACAKLQKIYFDKTGTITTGKFVVSKVDVVDKKLSKQKFLDIVVAGEKNSLHPIGKAICEYHKKPKEVKIDNFLEIAGKGISFEIKGKQYFIGKVESAIGKTVVGLYQNEKLLGKIVLQDEIKKEAKMTIEKLSGMEVSSAILSGDAKNCVKSVAKKVGIAEYRAELMPQDKFEHIDNESKNSVIAFVGDGLNDAPALTLSSVGISMGIMGSPATIEASDVVIADDNLNQIIHLIKISRKTRKIAWGNIIFAGITKLTFLLLGALGITGMLFAVFADVGVTLIAILNSLRVLKYKDK
ncbi:MAG: cadmium-translocating P-type ATPase [Clostridia bacterium]|nr:cadmium-translocating P-type ATPase [Clostridia bacterium]